MSHVRPFTTFSGRARWLARAPAFRSSRGFGAGCSRSSRARFGPHRAMATRNRAFVARNPTYPCRTRRPPCPRCRVRMRPAASPRPAAPFSPRLSWRNGHRRLPRVVIQMISPSPMRLKLAHHVSMGEIKDRVATLVLGASSLALALAPIFFLFWLMQPKVLANPGIGALRVAGAASYEPFLHDAEPPQSAEPPRRESAARLTQHDPQYREAATSAQREPPRPAQSRKTIKRALGFAQYSGGHRRWNGRGHARSYGSPVSPPAAQRRRTRPDSFVVARSSQDDLNARRNEITR